MKSADSHANSAALTITADQAIEEAKDYRHNVEKQSREVYLVHVIRPSLRRGQKFDIYIYLKKHRSDDLSDVSYGEFFLGRYWNDRIFKVASSDGLIGISISAYGPVLCTCRVTFKDGYFTTVSRYIDFEMATIFDVPVN